MTTLRNLEPAGHAAETVTSEPVKAYHAVLYARRKFKDQVQLDEPDPTTVSQIIAMKAHLQDLPDVTTERIYMDCQKMDSHQSLPQLQQLLLDIENGNYNCIVIYSLDTFGKDKAETEYYMLRQFPSLELRIISIQDNYDSNRSEPESGTFFRLEEILRGNMRSDRTCGETATETETDRGRWVFSKRKIPYGYNFNQDSESHMDVDPETAQYVRFIFEEYASGTSPGRIAKKLTAMNAPTPSMRKSQLGTNYKKMSPSNSWTFGSVSIILRNRMYAGDYVCGRENAFLHPDREDATMYWNSEEQIIPHHHKPLVPREIFDKVQQLQEQKRRQLIEKDGVPHNLPEYSSTPFRNHLFCGHCGRIMHFYHCVNVRHHYAVYTCSSRKKNLKNACSYAPIRLNEILPTVKQALSEERRLALKIYEQMKGGKSSEIYQRLEEYFQSKINVLTEAVNENPAGLPALKEKTDQQRQELAEAIKEKKAFHRAFKVTNPWLMLYTQLDEHFEITLDIARKYIYRIYLYPDAPAKFQPMKQEAKSNLLNYFNLIKNGDSDF